MNPPIDVCPECGERTLIAVCTVVVEYAITNEGEGDQDWSRRKVDDDTSEVESFKCDSCKAEFETFELNDDGYLVSLG